MCTTCGCGNPHSHTHIDENGNVVTHTHDHGDHDHNHAHGHTHSRTVSVEQDILARNNAIADENRALFAAKKILALNFVSSPGSGKTELLCATVRAKPADSPEILVIEGDQQTDNDANRIRATGAAAIFIISADHLICGAGREKAAASLSLFQSLFPVSLHGGKKLHAVPVRKNGFMVFFI